MFSKNEISQPAIVDQENLQQSNRMSFISINGHYF